MNKPKIIINFLFTCFIFLFFYITLAEVNVSFKASLSPIFLTSSVQDYKRLQIDQNQNTQTNQRFMEYDSKPSKQITYFVNPYDFEQEEQITSEEDGYFVQLGIFKTKEDANASIVELEDVQTLPPSLNHYIETRKIQDAVFFLSQVGVFAERDDAILFCNNLQKQGINCLILN